MLIARERERGEGGREGGGRERGGREGGKERERMRENGCGLTALSSK